MHVYSFWLTIANWQLNFNTSWKSKMACFHYQKFAYITGPSYCIKISCKNSVLNNNAPDIVFWTTIVRLLLNFYTSLKWTLTRFHYKKCDYIIGPSYCIKISCKNSMLNNNAPYIGFGQLWLDDSWIFILRWNESYKFSPSKIGLDC